MQLVPPATHCCQVSVDDLQDPASSPKDVGCADSGPDVTFRQYRAPRQHGERFVEPALTKVPSTLAANRQRLSQYGAKFDSLCERARRELLDSSIKYTSAYRDTDWAEELRQQSDLSIIMAGHQPSIFHPGVWFKNFALSHIAEQTNSIAVNLVIDNDVAVGCSVRVPTIDAGTRQARFESVPYDGGGGGVPYEQTTIREREMFDNFDDRVAEAIRPLVPDPSVSLLWKHARAAIARCGVAGCALAQARHGLEGELGLRTLELPLGVVCRSTAFAEFVLSILVDLPKFLNCYNQAADQYRQAHGIRSSAHPVPNLDVQDEWFEAPFWIYGNDSPQREPAWVKMAGDELVISDRKQRELRIDTQFPKLAAEQLANLASPNFKLRPRALLTTMYARLILSDLFLHGIGGGKYDQLGDMIIRAFFEIEPPEFMVISATIQLPDVDQSDYVSEIRRLKRELRDTVYQPERFADQVGMPTELLESKASLLQEVPTLPEKHSWHQRLEQINTQLSEHLAPTRERLRNELADVNRRMASQSLLASREHPFCIFPMDYLTDTFASLLK